MSNFLKELIGSAIAETKAGSTLPLPSKDGKEILLMLTGMPENNQAYASFMIRKETEALACEWRYASKAQVEQLLKTEISTENLEEKILKAFPLPQVTPSNESSLTTFNTGNADEKKKEEISPEEQNEMDGLMTAAERILSLDENIQKAISNVFDTGQTQIDTKLLAPQQVGYEFSDPENPEKKIFRPLSINAFNYLNGQLLLATSTVFRYDDITAPKPTGEMITSTFKASIKQEAKFEMKRSLKFSKLGISLGLNFSSFLPVPDLANIPDPSKVLQQHKKDKDALKNSNIIREGDPGFSKKKGGNDKEKGKDFSFGLEQIKMHAKMMLKAQRVLESSHDVSHVRVDKF